LKEKVKVKSRMECLKTEKNIGIETFFTLAKGIGGKLRTVPEDFSVQEISRYPPEKENGQFTVARVTEELGDESPSERVVQQVAYFAKTSWFCRH